MALWNEEPRLYLSSLALALFFLSGSYHVYQYYKFKAFRYFKPFIIGCVFQVVGYAGRIAAYYNQAYPSGLGAYVVQAIFTLVAPLLYAATIYGLLGRLIRMSGQTDQMPIPPNRITMLFVTGDVIAFVLQLSGSGLLASKDYKTVQTGTNIALAGLAFGLFFFVSFLILLFRLQWLAKHHGDQQENAAWHPLLIVMQTASVLILVRSIYRLAEFAMGYGGYLMDHEVFFYTLDSLLMLCVQCLFNYRHPSAYLNADCASSVAVPFQILW